MAQMGVDAVMVQPSLAAKRAAMTSRSLRRCPTAVTPTPLASHASGSEEPSRIYFLVESRLIPFEANAPHPTSEVHVGSNAGSALNDRPAEKMCPGIRGVNDH